MSLIKLTVVDHNSLQIETERLILRPFNLDEIEASYQSKESKYTGDGEVVSMQ